MDDVGLARETDGLGRSFGADDAACGWNEPGTGSLALERLKVKPISRTATTDTSTTVRKSKRRIFKRVYHELRQSVEAKAQDVKSRVAAVMMLRDPATGSSLGRCRFKLALMAP